MIGNNIIFIIAFEHFNKLSKLNPNLFLFIYYIEFLKEKLI